MQIPDDILAQGPNEVTEESHLASERRTAVPPSARVRLHARNTVLEFANGDVVTLPVGVGDLARDVLRHDSPTPAELERGIELVEDALTAARLPKADRGTFIIGGGIAARALPGLGTPEALLPLEDVEAMFQRLASRALGTPVTVADLPEGREIAAVLLLLRECMHHLGFAHIGSSPD